MFIYVSLALRTMIATWASRNDSRISSITANPETTSRINAVAAISGNAADRDSTKLFTAVIHTY